ncbi:MAG: hypothetical protein K2Y37_23790 [Pirellulales bacterium]|nr:hypothetical protein [Pirellulales bacterium]
MSSSLPNRTTCRCCGYINLESYGDICVVCGWTQDDYQESQPDITGGPNEISFREAQHNFVAEGHCYPGTTLSVSTLAERTKGYARDPRWMPLPQFES